MGEKVDKSFILTVLLVLVAVAFAGSFNSPTGKFFNFFNNDGNDIDDKIDEFFDGNLFWDGWYIFTDYLLYKPVKVGGGIFGGGENVYPPRWDDPIMLHIRKNMIQLVGPYYGIDGRHNYDGNFGNLNFWAYGSFIDGDGEPDGSGAAPWSAYGSGLSMKSTAKALSKAKIESAENNNNYKILANVLDDYKKKYANAFQIWAKYHGGTKATTKYDIPMLCNGENKITKEEILANGQTWACVDNCPLGFTCGDTESCNNNCVKDDDSGTVTTTVPTGSTTTKEEDGPTTAPGGGGDKDDAYCQSNGKAPNTEEDGSGDDINNFNTNEYVCIDTDCPGDKECNDQCKCPPVGEPPRTG
ncbi:MAG: hypothetical protein Q8Q42_04070 [Nanoarchaeota archaeon]|nr:hypothetical protein [Nanoarchaeota archaeon]